MIFRISSFFFAIVFGFTAYVYAVPPSKDLVITYDLTTGKRAALFKGIVQNKIPHKAGPDPYHVTLGWVTGVKPEDFAPLKSRLQAVANSLLPTASCTADKAIRYTVGNRTQHRCPIVLQPTQSEIGRFKAINAALFQDLQNYNAGAKKTYTFLPDVLPAVYTPHITLANTRFLRSHNLRRQGIIDAINKTLKGSPLKLIEPAIKRDSPAKPAVKKTPPAKPSGKAVASPKPAVKKKAQPIVRKKARPLKAVNMKSQPQRQAHIKALKPQRVNKKLARNKKVTVKRKPTPRAVVKRVPARKAIARKKSFAKHQAKRKPGRKAALKTKPTPKSALTKKPGRHAIRGKKHIRKAAPRKMASSKRTPSKRFAHKKLPLKRAPKKRR